MLTAPGSSPACRQVRVLSAQFALVILAGALSTKASTQTRAEGDSANPLRRCGVTRETGESANQYAVRCAERFVTQQGYSTLPGIADTTDIVPESIERGPSISEWLALRRGMLSPQAAGVCVDRHGWGFTVVFRAIGGRSARAVTLDAAFGSLRMQHKDFRFEAVEKGQYGCRPLRPPESP